VIPISAALLIAALVAMVLLYQRKHRLAAGTVGVLALSPLCYFVVGLFVPRITGEGHFFSFPFGGLDVSDANLLLSIAAWMAAWAALLGSLFLRRPST
jgi:hypothetical protein